MDSEAEYDAETDVDSDSDSTSAPALSLTETTTTRGRIWVRPLEEMLPRYAETPDSGFGERQGHHVNPTLPRHLLAWWTIMREKLHNRFN